LSNLLDLQKFYPGDIVITSKDETSDKIIVELKSKTKSQTCSKCGRESSQYHSTYMRKIIDLPILGKSVILLVTAYKYYCHNNNCDQKVFCEELSGFTGKRRRMTARCEDLVKTIALNTSCEAASMICKHMGVPISGDTIIRILLRSADTNYQCGEVIGVDYWAYKRRDNYGTIICDSQTRKPVSLLEGRDGIELKKWLEQNKHVKIVTRDRASSYAKAIKEVLPNAIQVADRFHLHQNLLEAVREAIAGVLPMKIEITNTGGNAAEITALENTKKN